MTGMNHEIFNVKEALQGPTKGPKNLKNSLTTPIMPTAFVVSFRCSQKRKFSLRDSDAYIDQA
jgi:hypothetical protein